MNFETIYYLVPEHIVSGFYGDYKLSPGRIRVESEIADILFCHGYCLSVKQAKGDKAMKEEIRKAIRKVEQAIKKISRNEAN